MKKRSLILTGIGLFVLFFVLSFGVLSSLDNLISSKVVNLWSPFLNTFFIFLSQYIFDTKVLCAFVVLLSLFLFKTYKEKAVLLLGSVGITAVISECIKYVFQHSRPVLSLVSETSYSFPSSHASISLVFFSVLIFIFKDEIKDKFLRNFFILSSVFLIILIGFSRIYLNAHYLSDVLAGYCLGGIALVLSLNFLTPLWKFIFNFFSRNNFKKL